MLRVRVSVAAALLASTIFLNLLPSASTECQLPPHFPPAETSSTAVLCVDSHGCCNFTVQAAVDAVPKNSNKRTIPWINSGIYFEKVTLTKANVTLQGQGLNSTVIVWNDTASSAKSTPGSASVYINADGFIAKNISFKNASPAPKPGAQDAQAVALRIKGDKAAFWGCGFFSAQDPLLDEQHRHYFKECFIEGSIDFIFGDGQSLYENCTLNSIAEALPQGEHSINGAITAQARKSNVSNSGFSFVGCTIQGTGWVLLGRAWEAFSRVVFAYTYMPSIVASEGWSNWGDGGRNKTVFYGEHGCVGDGANMAGRVDYARKLDDAQVQPFLDVSYIDGNEWIQAFNDSLIA